MPTVNPRGRQPIGVEQPPGSGTNYPFVRPSSDIQYLLGDLFVSFDDLDDVIEFPLKVVWLYGFGSNAVAPPAGWPAPTHSQDIIVADANDVVVFDSTTATTFTTDPWDSRLLILEWTTTDKILRCVQHTAWTQSDIDAGLDKTYDDYIEPTNGILQVDTWFKMPKRVTSLAVGLTTVEATRVVTFNEGYNMQLASTAEEAAVFLPTLAGSKPLSPGVRKSRPLSIHAIAGEGLGVFPGCADQELTLKTVNRIAGNPHQNFTYDSEGCIRSQRPVGLVSSNPREFDYASFLLSAPQAKAAIETLNDCQNCCDCTYFAQTYQGIKRQWYLYKAVADSAELTRDLFQQNIDRWEVQKAIRETDTVRIRVNMDGNCKVNWGFAHCNASRCCIYDVQADVTFLYYLNGVLTQPTICGYDCEKSEIDGSGQCNNGPEPIVMDVDETGQHAYVYWDYADPQTVTTVRGRFCFPDCKNVDTDALKIRMHVAISWENSGPDPANGNDCVYPLLVDTDYPQDVRDTWTALGVPVPAFGRAQSITPLQTVSSVNPYCERCGCAEPDCFDDASASSLACGEIS